MHEHLFNKNPPHIANMAGTQWRSQAAKPGDRLSLELCGDVFHVGRHGQLCCREPGGLSGENIESHDIVSAVQCAHEETVALWLAGSWRCNLGSNGTIAPHAERPVSLLPGKTTR